MNEVCLAGPNPYTIQAIAQVILIAVPTVAPRLADHESQMSCPGGFLAPTRSDELPCPDLELNVLQSITDVTAEVNAVVRPGLGAEEAYEARRSAITGIQKRSHHETGLRSDVVTLHRGGAQTGWHRKWKPRARPPPW